MGMIPQTFLLSGHARLPAESAAKTVYDILTVTVEVDADTWTVLQMDSTLITPVAQQFLRRHLVGIALSGSPEPVLEDLEHVYHAGAKRAVIAAVRDLYRNAAEIRGGLTGVLGHAKKI